MATKDLLITRLSEPVKTAKDKVTVVGCGMVGCASVMSIVSSGRSGEVVLCDMDAKKLEGEMKDFQHGSLYLGNCKVTASTDYAVTAGSRICVVTAGVRQQEGESRLDLVQRNVAVLKNIIPKLVQYSPDCIIVMVTNPVDVLTYVAWKLSGFPRHRVIGTGTTLDSARWRYFLGDKLGVAPCSVDAYILGEHGDNSVAAWSLVSVGGTRIKDINPKIGTTDDPENYVDMHRQVIQGAGEVIKLKGFTSWAIGATVGHIVGIILKNTLTVLPVSTFVQGQCGIEDDVVLSLPAILGEEGVVGIVQMTLSCQERSLLLKTAKLLLEIQNGLNFD